MMNKISNANIATIIKIFNLIPLKIKAIEASMKFHSLFLLVNINLNI